MRSIYNRFFLCKEGIGQSKKLAFIDKCKPIVRNQFPKNLDDLGSFTFTIQSGKREVGLALCDLGTSINLVLLSVFKALGLGKQHPTNNTLVLANISTW